MDNRGMGQGMIVIGMVFGMALLTLYFSDVEQQHVNPNESPQSQRLENAIEVLLFANRQGHYVVTGTLNGTEAEFLLDTGATDVVIPEQLARKVGLPFGRKSQAMTANGVISIWRTEISVLQIGDIELANIRASINPGMQGGAILLGMSALSQVEFIQSGNTLTLRQKSK